MQIAEVKCISLIAIDCVITKEAEDKLLNLVPDAKLNQPESLSNLEFEKGGSSVEILDRSTGRLDI